MTDSMDLVVKLGPDSGTPYFPLGEVVSLMRREIKADPEISYTELGVRSFHKGTFHRRTVQGSEFTWQDLYEVKKDDLIFSNIMAWEGAVALAKPEDDGCIGNHRMLTCACDTTRVNPAFLAHYFSTPEGMSRLVAASTGTAARNRTLTAKSLAKIEVPAPSIEKQSAIVKHLHAIEAKTQKLNEKLTAIEADANSLLAERFSRIIQDAPAKPLAEIAPIIRRPAIIELTDQYPELGVRSFGKGTFHKPALSGTEAGTKKLYRIEAGDLIFSNVFAWEGAIAIAGPEDNGRFGSHRFITCRTHEEITSARFLRYYFLTEKGLSQIREASPGGAGRNRTLGLEKLMAIQVPIPSAAHQKSFELLLDKTIELSTRNAAIRAASKSMIPATLERIFLR